jgi:ankyrin repeat protein
MAAVAHGNLEVMQVLLERGADVNHSDRWSTTALHVAAMHGRPDAVEV